MVRLSVLSLMAVGIGSVVVYWATASAVGQSHFVKAADNKPQLVVANRCQIEINGNMVPLQLGQGIYMSGGWRNCQSYDGHPIIVYSAKPPRSAVMENGG